ncbi:MAG: AI-2E family transporter [Ignavibacteriae bacterium]|nr:AI-2E family transporter [Ignavibacteriota bacterium]
MLFVFEPLNVFLTNRKIPQPLAIVVDLLLIIGFFWALSNFIIGSFSRFGEELPLYQQKLNNIVKSTALSFGINDPFFTEFNISQILSEIDYGGIASGLFSSTLSLFSAGFFVLFFFIFVSSSHKHILTAIKNRYVKSKAKISNKALKKNLITVKSEDVDLEKDRIESIKLEKEKTIEQTFKDITQQIQRYIATKFLISLVTGIIVGIILWIFNIDFTIVWAVMAFFLNFIPNIGSIIAIILPTVMTLIQYESIGYTFLVGGIITIIQNIIGNILEPKIMGDKLGLNPLVILVSLLVWGYIWGIAGMFLAVPITAVIKIIIANSKSYNLQFLKDLMGNSDDLDNKETIT